MSVKRWRANNTARIRLRQRDAARAAAEAKDTEAVHGAMRLLDNLIDAGAFDDARTLGAAALGRPLTPEET